MIGSSFFTSIKSKMKQDYGGRYVGLVLAECIKQQPQIAKEIWGVMPRHDFAASTEWSFSESRRADLALLDTRTGAPLALLEVKYDDHASKSNIAQLSDYLSYCEVGKIPFSYLTKYPPPIDQVEIIRNSGAKNQHISYGDLAKKLAAIRHMSPVVGMLLDYFAEEGCMYREIESKQKDALALLIARSARFPDRHGLGRKLTFERVTSDAPEVLRVVINNAATIGAKFYEHIYSKVVDGRTHRPVVNFSVSPSFNLKRLNKWATDAIADGDEEGIPDKSMVCAGDFSAWSHVRLPGEPWLYLVIGFSYRLKPNDITKDIESLFFVQIDGHQVSDYMEKDCALAVSEEKVYSAVLSMVNEMSSRVVKSQGDELRGPQKKVIEKIVSQISHHKK